MNTINIFLITLSLSLLVNSSPVKLISSDDEDNTINVIYSEKDAKNDPLEALHVPEGVKIKISDVISDPNTFLKTFVEFDNDSKNVTSNESDNETGNESGNETGNESGNETSYKSDYSNDSKKDNDLNVDTSQVSVSSLMRGFSSGGSDSVRVSSDRKRVQLPRISSPAGCATELRTIEIKDEAEDSDLYYPWCVRLPRCSGCCPSTRLKCVPTNTSIVDIVAVKLHYANFNQKFKYEGMRIFKMEQHESCRCECIQQATDCNKYQSYRPEECRCVCNDPVARAEECSKSDRIWNPDTCTCQCKYKHTCTTGTRFNHESCKCEIESHLINSVNELRIISDSYKVQKLSPIIDSEFKKQDERTRMSNDYYDGINPDLNVNRIKLPM